MTGSDGQTYNVGTIGDEAPRVVAMTISDTGRGLITLEFPADITEREIDRAEETLRRLTRAAAEDPKAD